MTAHDGSTTRPDAVATLVALRPQTDGCGEQPWSPHEQNAIRQRIKTGTDAVDAHGITGGITADTTGSLPPPRPRRQHAAALAFSAAVIVGGSGAAAASGLVPQAFIDAFPWASWPDGPPVDPADARRIATAPGPDGTVFTLMAAPAAADPGGRA